MQPTLDSVQGYLNLGPSGHSDTIHNHLPKRIPFEDHKSPFTRPHRPPHQSFTTSNKSLEQLRFTAHLSNPLSVAHDLSAMEKLLRDDLCNRKLAAMLHVLSSIDHLILLC